MHDWLGHHSHDVLILQQCLFDSIRTATAGNAVHGKDDAWFPLDAPRLGRDAIAAEGAWVVVGCIIQRTRVE